MPLRVSVLQQFYLNPQHIQKSNLSTRNKTIQMATRSVNKVTARALFNRANVSAAASWTTYLSNQGVS